MRYCKLFPFCYSSLSQEFSDLLNEKDLPYSQPHWIRIFYGLYYVNRSFHSMHRTLIQTEKLSICIKIIIYSLENVSFLSVYLAVFLAVYRIRTLEVESERVKCWTMIPPKNLSNFKKYFFYIFVTSNSVKMFLFFT